MRTIWVMVGLSVTVAAGAAILWPESGPPAPPEQNDPAQSSGRRVLSLVGGARGPVGVQSVSPPESRSAFSPVARSVPDMSSRDGPIRAPAPPRWDAKNVRPQVPPDPTGTALPTPSPAPTATPTTPTPARSVSPPAAAPGMAAPRPAPVPSLAEIERRRQSIEALRRQRQASTQRDPASSPSANVPIQTDRGRRQDASAQESNNTAGPPTIEELIRQNPWLADYAPGGRFADTTADTRATNSTTPRTNISSGTTRSPSLGGSSHGGTSTGGGTTTTSGTVGITPTATSASAKWVSIDNRSCGSAVAGYRTNDLYIRLDAAAPVLGMSSEANPITLTGGSLYQHAGGSDDAPVFQSSDACLRFDTHLNGGAGTGFSLLGGGTNNPVFTATRATGSLFNFAGVVGTQNRALFGDDGFYVLFGRFTASTSITAIAGKLQVETGIPGTSSFRSFTVDVPFDPAMWRFDSAFGLPAPTTGGTPPGGGTPPPDGGTPPPDGGTPPPDGGTPPPGGGTPPPDGGTPPPDPCAAAEPGLSAVWLPINNMGCSDPDDEDVNLANFRTADLYLRMAAAHSQSTTPPFSLQFVSAEVDTVPPSPRLTITNGQFFQHLAGGNTRPLTIAASQIPCLAFDSYVAIDTGLTEAPAANSPQFQPPPQLILVPGLDLFSQTMIRGLWVVPGFGPSSALPAAREIVRFPNDPCGWYVRIGRFTITRGATFSGTIVAGIVRAGEGTSTVLFVPVLNCAECWGTP